MKSASEEPRISSRLWVRTASVRNPSQQQAGNVTEGEFVDRLPALTTEFVRAVDALVLDPVAGVGAGQATQRHQPRHEAHVGVRFAGRNKLVHLVGLGEVVPRLGRGGVDRLHRPIQATGGFTGGTNPFRLRAMACILSCPSDKRGPRSAPQREKGGKG